MRTEGYQAIRCPSCGEGVFVLPRSPLPEPPAPSRTRAPVPDRNVVRATPQPDFDDEPLVLTDPIPTTARARARAGSDGNPGDVGEIEWVDDAAEEVRARPDEAAAPPMRPLVGSPAEDAEEEIHSAATREKPRRPTKARPEPSAVAPAPVPRVAFREWVGVQRNPLIFVGVALLVVGSFAIRAWRAHRAELPLIAARGRAEGLPALDAGKFELAHQILSEAKRAVEALGDQVEGAEDIKQGALEAAIIMALAPRSLEEMIEEAARSDEAEWQRNFRGFYAGRSVIIDARVVDAPDGRGDRQYELDYVVFPEGGDGMAPKSRGRIDTKGLRLFINSRPEKGDHVIFGARLSRFAFDREREEWRIGFEPESGVHMTRPRPREALGWPTGDETVEEGRP